MAAGSVVQLGTVTTVLGSANKDIVLYGNFLWIFKNTFFKEALESYLERELAKIQLLCADWKKCAGEVRALHRLFPTAGMSFSLSSRARWPLLPLCPSLWSPGDSLKHNFPHQRGLPWTCGFFQRAGSCLHFAVIPLPHSSPGCEPGAPASVQTPGSPLKEKILQSFPGRILAALKMLCF